jgi:translation initiation factor IF-2
MNDIKKPSTLSLNKTIRREDAEQQFSHGRKKTVTVEVRKKRTFSRGSDGKMIREEGGNLSTHPDTLPGAVGVDGLTESERQARLRALQMAEDNREKEAERRAKEAEENAQMVEEQRKRKEEEELRKVEREAARKAREEEEQRKREEASVALAAVENPETVKESRFTKTTTGKLILKSEKVQGEDEGAEAKKTKKTRMDDQKRGKGKLTLAQAMSVGEDDEGAGRSRGRSLASIRRAQEKARRQAHAGQPQEKVYREVTIPETITVQELANRMAQRATDVIRELMKMGMMVTTNDTLDADTAELIVGVFGHTFRRVTEADVENVLFDDNEEDTEKLEFRAPVVTIMGHVDHGKTSLLDALRSTDVAAGEAGGITQHIGAYRVTLPSGEHITFLDTPGHEAFTAMRLRGAHATDIVVLVVAADDGIMEQTVEAINHARAAGVPIIVAINKMDKPNANPQRVLNELLQYELVPESMGGDIVTIQVSAMAKTGLSDLEEAILLQAEMLDLKANPNRDATGVVIESRIDKARGSVATLLVQKGTLKVGDIVLAGTTMGRVRAMTNEHGKAIDYATPSMPVELLGLDGAPTAGENFAVVITERQAREIIEYREKRGKDLAVASRKRGSLEHLFSKASGSGVKELPVIVKGDVNGSVEAIIGSLARLGTDEVEVRVLHGAAGGITESDIALARASNAIIIGFNVRANAGAKEISQRENVPIRYYSIIYNLVDDIRKMLGNMLEPEVKENYLGTAEIRQIFTMSKHGKVAGCYVTDGIIKRGAGVRLLRDNIVIHEGKLKTLRRFKDDVKEVAANFECGMAFENYEDIKEGDQIEAFELVEEKREL